MSETTASYRNPGFDLFGELPVEVRNLAHLAKIIKSIQKLPGVDRVERAAVALGDDLFDPIDFQE